MSLAARIARAIFWGQAARVVEAAVFSLFYLWLARALGPAGYGVFALGMSLAGACAFFALAGLGPETLGRFVPEVAAGGQHGRARRLLGDLLAVRALAILTVGGVVYMFRRPLTEKFHLSFLSASFGLLLLLFASRSIFDLLAYFSSGLLDLKRVAAAKSTAAVAAPGLFLAFSLRGVRAASSAWLAVAVGLLAGIFVVAAPFLCSGERLPAREPRAVSVRQILAFGMFAWATNLFLYILGDNTDVLLLGWLLPDRDAVGCYAAGAKIVFSLTSVALGWVALSNVASLSEAWQRGGMIRLASVAEAQWKLAALCLLAPLLFLVRYAREIVAIFYSSAYAPSVPVVEILGGLMACAVICGFSLQGGILYALDRERIACAVIGSAAAFNLVSEIFLVRRMGMEGAAWATGLSFVLLAVLCTAAAALCAPVHIPARFIGRVAAAAALGIGSTFWLHPGSLATLAFAGFSCAAVFFGCLAIFKPLTGSDSARLHRVNPTLGAWAERWFMDMRGRVKEA